MFNLNIMLTLIRLNHHHIGIMKVLKLNMGTFKFLYLRSEEPYEAICKIGRGKYSEVFEGLDNRNGMKVILKVLKPVKKRKIRREIRIL